MPCYEFKLISELDLLDIPMTSISRLLVDISRSESIFGPLNSAAEPDLHYWNIEPPDDYLFN